MKSEHRAKADFLRELAKYAKALYELGDFTCEDEKRVNLSSKIEGFAAAGSIIELITRAETQVRLLNICCLLKSKAALTCNSFFDPVSRNLPRS